MQHLQRAAQVGALAGTVGLTCSLAEAAEGRQLAGVEPVGADRALGRERRLARLEQAQQRRLVGGRPAVRW